MNRAILQKRVLVLQRSVQVSTTNIRATTPALWESALKLETKLDIVIPTMALDNAKTKLQKVCVKHIMAKNAEEVIVMDNLDNVKITIVQNLSA
jgi:hypothetical protein